MIERLPSYEDSEVAVFHPVCEYALNEALKNLSKETKYEVLHHVNTGSIIPDFAVRNISTHKYILFVEVKRNKFSVSSTRYRLQAQSYVTESFSDVEKPYFALTNLEVMDLFKYDANRYTVQQQIIEPSPFIIGDFSNDKNIFINKLIKSFEKMFSIILEDQPQYKNLTGMVFDALESFKADSKENNRKWNNSLLVVGYEYIRSILRAYDKKINWQPAFNYKPKLDKLKNNIEKINFNSLTNNIDTTFNNREIWNGTLLNDVYELGSKTKNPEELVEMLNDIVTKGREHEGLVPTDLELSNLLSIMSKKYLAEDIKDNEYVLDPAAGSGNLLVSAAHQLSLSPRNIWANEIVEKYESLLSLRLGLLYPGVIAPTNSPKISVGSIIELVEDELNDVRLMLLNPPYVSGVKNTAKKKAIANRIEDLFKNKSITNVGQVGIEAPFLELATKLTKDGTIIGAVFPKQYIYNTGKANQKFREFLLTEFGLKAIFIYPRNGVFEKVIKDTVILIGEKNSDSQSIDVINSHLSIADIDFNEFKSSLNLLDNRSHFDTYSGNYRKVSKAELKSNTIKGWRFINDLNLQVDNFISNNFNQNYQKLKSISTIKRGNIANVGGSSLIYINSNKEFWNVVKNIVPKNWLELGIERVKNLDNVILNKKNVELRAMIPSDDAFIKGTADYQLLDKIIDEYLNYLKKNKDSTEKQRKDEKTKEQLRKILASTKKNKTNRYNILIPRNIRKYGRVFLNTEPIYVSSNLIKVEVKTKKEALTLLSWLLSVYAQLQFEGFAKNQEGTRKVELGYTEGILVPDNLWIKNITKKEVEKLIVNSEFMDLTDIKANQLNVFWNNQISSKFNQDLLNEVIELTSELVTYRSV